MHQEIAIARHYELRLAVDRSLENPVILRVTTYLNGLIYSIQFGLGYKSLKKGNAFGVGNVSVKPRSCQHVPEFFHQ